MNAVRCLHKLEPRPRVIAMSSELELDRTALAAGADAFISKNEASDWLIESLQVLQSQTGKVKSENK